MDEYNIIKLFTHKNLIGKEREVLDLYHNQEFSIPDIAKKFELGNSSTVLNVWFNLNGFKLRTFKEARNISKKYEEQRESLFIKFTEEEISNICNLYNDGYSAKYIAKQNNIDSCVIFRILKENKIEKRNHKDSVNSKKCIESRNVSILEKYGGWDEFRQMQSKVFYEKHGVNNPMQIGLNFYKQQESSRKFKSHEIDGVEFKYQGFELLAINKLIDEGYLIQDIKIGRDNVPSFRYFFDEKRRVYYPDIYIPKDNRIVEVKSFYTYEKELDKNLAKRESVITAGYLFDFYIMEK